MSLLAIDLESSYAEAHSLYQSGFYAKAADLFRSLCSSSPLESRFWFGLGASYQESCQYPDALRAWAMAALLSPEDPYPHFHAAQCLISSHQLSDAALALQEAKTRARPSHPLLGPIQVLEDEWSHR